MIIEIKDKNNQDICIMDDKTDYVFIAVEPEKEQDIISCHCDAASFMALITTLIVSNYSKIKDADSKKKFLNMVSKLPDYIMTIINAQENNKR